MKPASNSPAKHMSLKAQAQKQYKELAISQQSFTGIIELKTCLFLEVDSCC